MTLSPNSLKNLEVRLVGHFCSSGYEPDGYTHYTCGTIQAWARAAEQARAANTAKGIKIHRASNRCVDQTQPAMG